MCNECGYPEISPECNCYGQKNEKPMKKKVKKKNSKSTMAERFENKIKKWSLLKTVIQLWSNTNLKVWEKQLLLHSYANHHQLGCERPRKTVAKEIGKLQRDRNRALKLLKSYNPSKTFSRANFKKEVDKYLESAELLDKGK